MALFDPKNVIFLIFQFWPLLGGPGIAMLDPLRLRLTSFEGAPCWIRAATKAKTMKCWFCNRGPLREKGRGGFCPRASFMSCARVGRHLVGVWIGGVCNGHFPESENSLQRPKSRKILEVPQKERPLPNFRPWNSRLQRPSKRTWSC